MSAEQPRRKTIDYGEPLGPGAIKRGRHRKRVGGLWETMGQLQRDLLIARGLQPHHRLLDVGCGALRAGAQLVDYLDPGNYYGIDINESLLQAGYEHELSPMQRERLPRDQLRATARFDCDFGVTFDYAIAQSVFTHISLNHLRLCLYRVGEQIKSRGRFYVSYFEAPVWHPLDEPLINGRRWTERNTFFYYRSDLRWAGRVTGWSAHHIGDWDHPRKQRLVEFRRSPVRLRPLIVAPKLARTLSPSTKRAVRRALKHSRGGSA